MHLFWIMLWVVGLTGFLLFTFVIAFGAPFLPILKNQVEPALDLIDLKPNQTLLELGSGDGRILLAAAKRGINSVGYELNPLLVIYSKLMTWRYRKCIKVYWGNYWNKDWPKSDGIFVFLLQPYMNKLDKKIMQYNYKPVKLVSFAFTVDKRKPTKKLKGLYLYTYK
jgi:hypothetical protein